MITEKQAANAMGGKTARACDGCLRKRARWYCAADDAFLCQACDASVHTANQLASRHERVRLQTASSKPNETVNGVFTTPAWHQGFTRKARTPRPNKALLQQVKDEDKLLHNIPMDPLVPEIGSEEASADENEEQLLYRVPEFNPFAEELSNTVRSEGTEVPTRNSEDGNIAVDDYGQEGTCELDNLHGLLPSDMDLAEFAADVESLLGGGLDDDSFDIKEPGLLDCETENDMDVCFNHKVAKVKDEELEVATACHLNPASKMNSETLDWNFCYDSPIVGEEGEEDQKLVPVAKTSTTDTNQCETEKKNDIFLRLNYEAVISAWASQGSPWTAGSRPEFNPDDFWPHILGLCPKDVHYPYGDMGGVRGHARGNSGEREARVSRYREKRRTRLFSKKIRYEVRKLNAEKRPRMKGRFVKRTSLLGTGFPYLNK